MMQALSRAPRTSIQAFAERAARDIADQNVRRCLRGRAGDLELTRTTLRFVSGTDV
jgi:hypothetical protein